MPDPRLMRTELLLPSSPDWATLVAGLRADAYYMPGYAEACARHEAAEARLFVAIEDGSIWLQPLLVRPIPGSPGPSRPLLDAISPYGYSGPLARVGHGADERAWLGRAAGRFKQCLAEHGIVSMVARLHPLLNTDLDALRAHGAVTQRGSTVVIALGQPCEELWHQTRRDHRRDINKLRRAGFTASITNENLDLVTFRAIYEATMRRVRAAPDYFFPEAYYHDLVQAMAGKLFLCVVKHGDCEACAGLFTEVDDVVQFHLSGTADDFLSWHPSKLMLHFVRDWAKARGNEFFHLGGGIGGSPDPLLDFKSGFSETILPFYTWDLIVDQRAYDALVDRHFTASSSATMNDVEYFPLYRAQAKHCRTQATHKGEDMRTIGTRQPGPAPGQARASPESRPQRGMGTNCDVPVALEQAG